MKKIITTIALVALFPKLASAHCPLCTVGAGALAVAAASVGVSTATVGVFIGAFALALGLWLARIIKKKYFPHQDAVVAVAVFLSTIIPIMPLIREYRPLYVSLMGEYGSPLHNTYTINLYILGAAVGAVLLFLSPYISKVITEKREGKTLPYQGLSITFILLIVAGVILQFIT